MVRCEWLDQFNFERDIIRTRICRHNDGLISLLYKALWPKDCIQDKILSVAVKACQDIIQDEDGFPGIQSPRQSLGRAAVSFVMKNSGRRGFTYDSDLLTSTESRPSHTDLGLISSRELL